MYRDSTVAGETKFNETYNENILVNAMAVGHVKKNKIFYSKARGLNKAVVYVGSKTGRDGIHGASMASAEFDENSEEKTNCTSWRSIYRKAFNGSLFRINER